MNERIDQLAGELRDQLRRHHVVILWQEVEGTVCEARRAARALSAELVEAVGPAGLFLSRTATRGLAGVAACSRCSVGLDAERGHPAATDADVRTRALHPGERRPPAPSDPESFFGLWARKEAVLKALGVGLRLDPRRVEVGWPDQSWRPVVSPAGERLEVRSITAPGATPAAIALGPVGAVGGSGPGPQIPPVLYQRAVPHPGTPCPSGKGTSGGSSL